MTDPKPASVADHEASHAVVWWRWWWESEPHGYDPGNGREIWWITIKPAKGKWGGFEPVGPPMYSNLTADDRLCLEHECATGLAGPIADERRNERRNHTTTDEQTVRSLASQFFHSAEKESIFLEDLRPKVELFLERPDVRAMVRGLAEALLEHKTLGHEEAVKAMEAGT